jgi:hypothetical protein
MELRLTKISFLRQIMYKNDTLKLVLIL